MMDHSETVDAPLTDLELGDLASDFEHIEVLPPPRFGFFITDCILGRTMRRILEDATMAARGGRSNKNKRLKGGVPSTESRSPV